MIIGVPRERKTLEKRVGITPDGAAELVKQGHTVLIETNAGNGSLFYDQDYQNAGCQIVSTLEEVWKRANLIVKVKEPHESEYQYFRPDVALFDYLHMASMPDMTQAMLKSGITGIAFELVRTDRGRYSLLDPMSEVAGKLAVLNGANYLLAQNGGRGVLLGGTVTVPPRRVIIIGAGISGRAACEMAVGMGAKVGILDNDVQKLERIKDVFGTQVTTIFSTSAALAREIPKAELLIGAVLVPGARTPRLITREMIKTMRPGTVFVDISIDQGGCAETSRPTDLENPTYVVDGVVHYGVCNMPAQVPRTSTIALAEASLPYVMKLANSGIKEALQKYPELQSALNTYQGKLTNKAIGESLDIPYVDAKEVV